MKQILVVDDERVIREVLSALFTGEGYAVLTAGDGLDALEALHDASPDLVIADIIMPRLDGWGLLARLRTDHPEIPVVLLSATFRGTPPTASPSSPSRSTSTTCCASSTGCSGPEARCGIRVTPSVRGISAQAKRRLPRAEGPPVVGMTRRRDDANSVTLW